ncbi:MAG: hypothetical protein JSU65_03795, partial [Candidatus Zixiibacteriota bacterium]
MNRMVNVTGYCASIMLLVTVPAQEAHDQSYSQSVTPRPPTPITYTANLGQLDEHVSFLAEAGDVTLYFHPDGVTHLFLRDTDRPAEAYEIPFADQIDLPDKNFIRGNEKEITVTRTRFVDANPDPDIVGIDRQAIIKNYIIGNDPSGWHTSVPCYSAILYKDIYPGIDLKYHSQGYNVKYDYVVHPGGDISVIKLRHEGMEALAVTTEGKLRFENNVGAIEEGLPLIFQ